MKKFKLKNYISYIAVSVFLVVSTVMMMTGSLDRSIQNLITQISYSIILAVSLNLVVGFLGELSLGHAGFMCVGAYLGGKASAVLEPLLNKVPAGKEIALMISLVVGGLVAAVFGITKVAALAYLMFNLFTPPCFAAIGAMNSEMKSAKWLWGGIGLQMATGYTVGFLVYQIGTLITEGTFGAGFIPGLVTVLAIASVIVYFCVTAEERAEKTKA